MTYTKTLASNFQKIVVARTHERALVATPELFPSAIIERSIWRDEDGKGYVQYKKTFYKVVESSCYLYKYHMTFEVR